MAEKKINAKLKKINYQLDLIEDINKDIESSKKVGSSLMVRQYEHLKKQYTKNLLALLAEYKLSIRYLEVA